MTLVKNKLAVAVAIALSTSFGLVGCGDDKSVSTAVGVPNPNTLMPTGTVQGVLRDSVTNEPIVGAVVDIGIAKATTTETGQFVIKDVPATTSTGASGAGGNAPYQVTIDLRNVKQATGAAKYPSFSFATAAVSYSSLNDGSNDAGTSSSNHDTPVTGLTAPLTLTVGKLAAGIKGTVAKAMDFKAVGAGYTVKLVSLGSSNSTTGATGPADGKFLNGNVVATTTTDAAGAFVFSGIESLRDFQIEVVNADGTEYGSEPVRAPADGQVKTLLAQRGEDTLDLRTVLVKSTDTLAPRVVKSTPETGTERAPGANVTVTFSFSEPIVSNGLTNSLTASTAGNGGLYDLVDVQFKGIKDIAMKAGNIPYSLAWDESRTQLTVIIPNVKASAKYEVSIAGAKDILVDNQGYKTDFAFDGSTSANAGVVKFSTNADGATKPVAVSTLAITNSADLDQTNNAVVDWLPVAGAKGYHVYRAKFVNDVMDSKGYEPIKRTVADTEAAIALLNSKQALADAAKAAVAAAKTEAGIKAQVLADAAQNANVADVTANQAVKAVTPTTTGLVTSTATSADLTATAAVDSRASDKVAALSQISDKASALKVAVVNVSAINAVNDATSSNRATAIAAQTKVAALNTAVNNAENQARDAAYLAAVANFQVRTVNTKAKVAAEVAKTIDAVAASAAAVSAVSAAASNVAAAKVAAAQAAYDANPNDATLNVLNVAKETLKNANKVAQAKADEAKVAAEAANKALEAAKAAATTALNNANDAKDAADTAKTDANNAKIAADTAKTNSEAAAKAKEAADKAVVDAKKDAADATTALNTATTEAAAADAATDLAAALLAVAKAETAALNAVRLAAFADKIADQATAAAEAAAEAAVALAAANTEATAAANAVTAALAAIEPAVKAADEAADAVDVATANDAAAGVNFDVLDNNAKLVDAWRAKTAGAVAKAMLASKVLVVTKKEAEDAKNAAKAAAVQADNVAKAAKDIADKATVAKTAIAATKAAADAAATKAVAADTKAKADVSTATAAVTTAATALTTAANATTTTEAVKTAVADAVAAVGTSDATAKTAAAKAAADAAKAAADAAKAAADTAKTNADTAKTNADTAKTNADAAKAAADAAKVAADAAAAAAVPGTPDAAAKNAAAAAATAAAAAAATAATNAAAAATNAATAATNAATAVTNAATAATNAANVVAKVNILIKAQAVETNAIKAMGVAASDLTAANVAKAAAQTAFDDATVAETAAKKALVDATTAKTAADKLATSMTAAETSLNATVAAKDAAVKATADALTASTDAANAAATAATAAMNKQQADKDLASKVKAQAAADKDLADAQGAVDSNGGYGPNSNDDLYLTQNTSFVEDGSAKFVDGIRKITYKYKVRAVSENNVESVDSNEVEAKDNTAPKVSSFTMNTASNVITVVFTEPMNELDFRNQANYVLSAPTGVTVPALSSKMFKIDNKTVVLTYAANIPAGSTVTVKGVKDLAGNTMSEVGNSATVDKVSSSIAGFVGSTQVTVFFTAEMDKASAETAANYVWSAGAGPALLAENGVVYDAANNSVTLTYVSAIPAGVTLTVSGVTDANGTVVDSNTKTFN